MKKYRLGYIVIAGILFNEFGGDLGAILLIISIGILELFLFLNKIREQQKFIHIRLQLIELMLYAEYSKKGIVKILENNDYFSINGEEKKDLKLVYKSILEMLGKQDGDKNPTALERLKEFESYMQMSLDINDSDFAKEKEEKN